MVPVRATVLPGAGCRVPGAGCRVPGAGWRCCGWCGVGGGGAGAAEVCGRARVTVPVREPGGS
ncbi:hypothetical protein DEJ01_12725 [Curtobacterium sp. MCLR17_040]|nr:hypothetical protein DEJ01_12725 [Curtobacterium sp. MCLR17_040]